MLNNLPVKQSYSLSDMTHTCIFSEAVLLLLLIDVGFSFISFLWLLQDLKLFEEGKIV